MDTFKGAIGAGFMAAMIPGALGAPDHLTWSCFLFGAVWGGLYLSHE